MQWLIFWPETIFSSLTDIFTKSYFLLDFGLRFLAHLLVWDTFKGYLKRSSLGEGPPGHPKW